MYIAEMDGEIGGYVICRIVNPLFFAAEMSVVIDAIFVAPEMRRRGLGHGLMSAVAAMAAVAGAPYIYAAPPLADRGMQRFLAQLSFAPAGGHRIAQTAVLLRKLGRDDPITQGIQIRARSSRQPNRVSIDEVIAKRKRARNGITGVTGEQTSIIQKVS
jgi:GNAT superfamily N-acetyltransferase